MMSERRDPLLPWLAAALFLHAVAGTWLASRSTPSLDALPVAAPPLQVSLRQLPPPAPAPEPIPEPVVERPPKPAAPAPRPAARKPEPAPPPAVSAQAPVAPAAPAVPRTAPAAVEAAVAAPPPAVATPDEVQAYIEQVWQRIAAEKRYPALARRRGVEGVVSVRLDISRDGGLEALELAAGAPSVLAGATSEAVERAAPFPEPPPGVRRIRIPIRFRLDD